MYGLRNAPGPVLEESMMRCESVFCWNSWSWNAKICPRMSLSKSNLILLYTLTNWSVETPLSTPFSIRGDQKEQFSNASEQLQILDLLSIWDWLYLISPRLKPAKRYARFESSTVLPDLPYPPIKTKCPFFSFDNFASSQLKSDNPIVLLGTQNNREQSHTTEI